MFEIVLIVWALVTCYFIWSFYEALEDKDSPVDFDLLPMWLLKAWGIFFAVIWPITMVIVYLRRN